MASSFLLSAITAVLLPDVAAADMPLFTDISEFTSFVNASHGIPTQRFRSSDIIAPVWLVNSWDSAHIDGASHLFLGTIFGPGRAGPMIFSARDLSLVYADQQYDESFHSDVRIINGTRHLTVWVKSTGGGGARSLVFDDKYDLKYNITAQGMDNDMHEMQVTPEGTIILSTYSSIPFDCSSVGGPPLCVLRDSGFQEVDPTSNEIIFNWVASEHFDIVDSYEMYNNSDERTRRFGYDFFHINSIEKTASGSYLISSRNFALVALINGTDGSAIWRLGGRHNQFRDLSNGTATNFQWQHDARFHHNQSRITIFDNHVRKSAYCEEKCHTRGLLLEMDAYTMTARVLHQYTHPQGIDSRVMGSMQILGSDNILLGFGANPGIAEYTLDGIPVLDIQRGSIGVGEVVDMRVYRVSKHNWTGMPTWPPSIAVDASTRTTRDATVYVSWNGATEIASWVVLASNDSATMDSEADMVARYPRSGFETAIHLETHEHYNYIRAAAVSASDQTLGYTAIIDLESNTSPDSHVTTAVDPATSFIHPVAIASRFFLVAAAVYLLSCPWVISSAARSQGRSQGLLKRKSESQEAYPLSARKARI